MLRFHLKWQKGWVGGTGYVTTQNRFGYECVFLVRVRLARNTLYAKSLTFLCMIGVSNMIKKVLVVQ